MPGTHKDMKPDLIIIGSQKCGTSSLHHHLDLHPDISMSAHKELDFFVEELNWKKGIQWYESQFKGIAKLHGESSPSYTMYPNFSGVPERMHSYVPNAKLLYIVRDPIDRIVSHYLHQWYARRVNETLSSILSDLSGIKAKHYLNASSYYLQLSQYLDFYELSNIYIISLESLKGSPEETMRGVFRFLEVDDTCVLPQDFTVFNATKAKFRTNKFGYLLLSKSTPLRQLVSIPRRLLPHELKRRIRPLLSEKQGRPAIESHVRELLKSSLREDINRFRKLTGQEFDQWSI